MISYKSSFHEEKIKKHDCYFLLPRRRNLLKQHFYINRFSFTKEKLFIFDSPTINHCSLRNLTSSMLHAQRAAKCLHTVCISKCKMSRRNIGRQMRIVYNPQSEARLPNMIPHTGTEVRIDFHGIDASP